MVGWCADPLSVSVGRVEAFVTVGEGEIVTLGGGNMGGVHPRRAMRQPNNSPSQPCDPNLIGFQKR